MRAKREEAEEREETYAAGLASAAVAVSAVMAAAVTRIHLGLGREAVKDNRRFHSAFVDELFDVLESSVFWRGWMGEEEG
jgi:hypothetical protein